MSCTIIYLIHKLSSDFLTTIVLIHFHIFRDNNVKNVIGMEIESLSCRGMLDARLCDQVCQ